MMRNYSVLRALVSMLIPSLLLLACGEADAAQDPAPEDLIALAVSAAPAEIGDGAAVVDLEGRTLRQGSNDWTCIPVQGAPLCLDRAWMSWFDAYVRKTAPPVMGLGISYMLAGDQGSSNNDPFATGPTPENDWVVSGPHLMLVAPNLTDLDALPTDHRRGGPYVMWKGTPYAHVMVPVPPPAP
jgi:hypothetical protein